MKNQYTRWQTRRRSLPDQKKSGNGWILGKLKDFLNEHKYVKVIRREQVFMNEPPDLSIIELKQDIFKLYGIKPENLFECFIDSDCEFLIDRLIGLCDLAIQENRPIMFQ